MNSAKKHSYFQNQLDYCLIILSEILLILGKTFQGLYWYLFRRKSFPKFIKKILLDFGPVYTKLGQVCSTRSDLFSQPYLDELSKLRDHCPAESKKVIISLLNNAYPLGIETVFAEFDDQPIAAGTVAQVHVAKLHNQEKVAVKILRPKIKQKIEANFKLLLGLVSILEKLIVSVKTLNIHFILEEMSELLLSQTDLTQEANNYLKFQKVYQNDPILLIPKVYPELSSSSVMVMEYVEAIEPYQFEQLNINPHSLASKIDYMIDNMVYLKGLCHADLHPGNFFWNQEGKVVLIDLGLIHQINFEDRNHIATFYFCIVDGFYDLATDYFFRFFVISNSAKKSSNLLSKEMGVKLVSELLEKQTKATGGRPKLSVIFPEIIRIMSLSNWQFKPNFSKILLSLATVEGYLYALDPTFDILELTEKRVLSLSRILMQRRI
jgi:predicted unusual protein kinase regulating ubiquinone biosynthesis (AarF/ABC1/UbiB family)